MGIAILMSHKETVPFLAEKYLHDFGIEYSSIEGTLLEGVVIYEFRYKDVITAKSVRIEYNFLHLFRPTPNIKKIELQNLSINVEKLSISELNASASLLPAFSVNSLLAKHTKIIFSKESIVLDINASDLTSQDTLNVKKVALNLQTSYVNAAIQGEIKSDILYADANAELNRKVITNTLAFIKTPPQKFQLKLQAGLESIKVLSRFDKLQLAKDEAFLVQNAEIDIEYVWGMEDFQADAVYDVLYAGYEAKVQQKIHFDIQGRYDSQLRLSLLNEPLGVLFKDLVANISGDTKGIEAQLNAEKYRAHLKSTDYQNFDIEANADDVVLASLDVIPAFLKEEKFTLHAKGTLQASPFIINAEIEALSTFGKLNVSWEEKVKRKQIELAFYPNAAHAIYQNYNMEQLSPLHAKYSAISKREKLEINTNKIYLKLQQKDVNMFGSGNIGDTKFDLLVDLEKKEINLVSNVGSLKRLLTNMYKKSVFDTEDVYDAKIDFKATINYEDKLSIKSHLSIPLYLIKVDAQSTYAVENIRFETSYKDGNLLVENYFFRYQEHDFYSKRASHIRFDKDFNIALEEVWLYESVLVEGFVHRENLEGNVTFKSESFTYTADDADVKARVNLEVNFTPKVQKIEGTITLLEGVIRYKPRKDYLIDDADIIIIQEIKESKKRALYINVQVDALKPIAYKIKDVNLMITPEITLFEEPNSAFGVLGVVTINEGDVSYSGKKFIFDKSEIYFNGSRPINPQLNLNLHYYTVDYTDIEIYVTNTMEDPVVIFSSKPALSQNDIMSYILFGEPASTLFVSSSETSKSSLLLASGIKQLVNGSSFVQVDTLNILTNKEGTLGYEIGTRFNEKIRIVYKNDTASSLTLQYSLSRSLRLDVDIRETGQGVSIIYIKDM